MHGPPVVGWLLTLLTGGAGLLCLARLLLLPAAPDGCAGPGDESGGGRGHGQPGGEAGGRESDAAEGVMGLGMAVMALPAAGAGAVPPAAWAGLFGAVGAWFLAAALRPAAEPRDRAHRLHHALGAAAMVYLALAMAAAGGGGGHPGGHAGQHTAGGAAGGLPLLTGVLLLYFGGYALWAGSRLVAAPAGPGRPGAGAATSRLPAGRGAGGGAALLRLPGLPQACRVVMGVAMFAMLLVG